jgi:hypothetical protein
MRRIWLGLGLAAVACAPVQVVTRADADTDFSRFTTYAQLPPPAETPDAPVYTAALGEQIQREIASLLDAKGYRPVPAQQADMKVAFNVSHESRERLVVAADPDANYAVEEPYVQGTLEIEVLNAHGRQVWHGRGVSDVLTTGSLIRESPADAALAQVRAILEKFPAAH